MKTILWATVLTSAFFGTLQAQEPVSVGTILAVSAEAGTLTLRSEKGGAAPLVFSGINRAKIRSANGEGLTLAKVTPGMAATVHYTQIGTQLTVSWIDVAPATILPAAQVPAVSNSTTALDHDITKQPGSKAAVDNDITTQPGSKAATDNDITTQPGSKAATDNDITTQPGSKAATDNDVTTQPGSKAATDDDITTRADRK